MYTFDFVKNMNHRTSQSAMSAGMKRHTASYLLSAKCVSCVLFFYCLFLHPTFLVKEHSKQHSEHSPYNISLSSIDSCCLLKTLAQLFFRSFKDAPIPLKSSSGTNLRVNLLSLFLKGKPEV